MCSERTFPQGKDHMTSHCDLCPSDPEDGVTLRGGGGLFQAALQPHLW